MRNIILDSLEQHLQAVNSVLRYNMDNIEKLCETAVSALSNKGKLLIAGNGGSAADSQHIAAEFIGRFRRERPALAAIALTTDSSIMSSIGNDYGFDQIYVRQVHALCQPNDIFLVISTSGNSENLVMAVAAAKRKHAITVGLLGKGGGKLSTIVDIPIVIDSDVTARIQECHILIAHILCEVCDEKFTSDNWKAT